MHCSLLAILAKTIIVFVHQYYRINCKYIHSFYSFISLRTWIVIYHYHITSISTSPFFYKYKRESTLFTNSLFPFSYFFVCTLYILSDILIIENREILFLLCSEGQRLDDLWVFLDGGDKLLHRHHAVLVGVHDLEDFVTFCHRVWQWVVRVNRRHWVDGLGTGRRGRKGAGGIGGYIINCQVQTSTENVSIHNSTSTACDDICRVCFSINLPTNRRISSFLDNPPSHLLHVTLNHIAPSGDGFYYTHSPF